MRVKPGRFNRVLALVLAVMMTAALLPLSALGKEGFFFGSPEVSEFIYYYTGIKQPLKVDGDAALTYTVKGPAQVEGEIKTGVTGTVDILQYQLANTADDKEIFTYCSDFAVKPVVMTPGEAQADKDALTLYQRIQIEGIEQSGVKLDGTFFKANNYSVTQTAEKLRAILLKSDLWYNQDTTKTPEQHMKALADAAGITSSLTDADVIATVQLAIWHVVNGATPSIPSGTAREKLYKYLISDNKDTGVPGVKADDMARLVPVKMTKVVGDTDYQSGEQTTYTAEVEFALVGHGADDVNVNFGTTAKVVSVYSIDEKGNQQEITKANYTAAGTKVTVPNVLMGRELEIVVSTVETEVTNIYLYVPQGGRGSSQTLVSVEREAQDLETIVNVESPNGLARLSFTKSWVTGNNYPLGDQAVQGYQSRFVITHASGDEELLNSFYGTEVWSGTLDGNQAVTTGYIFQFGKIYKISEIVKDIVTPEGTSGAPVGTTERYFTVVLNDRQEYTIAWCDENDPATNTAGYTGAFVNKVDLVTGSVTVSKTVTTSPASVPIPDQAFTFAVYYTAPNGTSELYKNAGYTLTGGSGGTGTTGETGTLTLKHGQTATFQAIPAGATLEVVEAENTGYNTTVAVNGATAAEPRTGSVTVAKDGEHTIAFTNEYITGNLTINKTFAGADWAAVNAAGRDSIDFQIKQGDTVVRTATLNYPETSVIVYGLPVGDYTVTEVNAGVDTYVVTVTSPGNDGNLETVSIEADQTATANFTNTYSRASVTVSKTVNPVLPVLREQAPETFNFTLESPLGTTVTGGNLTDIDENHSGTVTNLAPGTYYIRETNDTVDNLRLTVTASSSDVYLNKVSDGLYSFTIAPDSTAEIIINYTNTYAEESAAFTLKKTVEVDGTALNVGQLKTQYPSYVVVLNVTGPNDFNKEYTLNKDNNWSASEPGVALGEYVVTELSATGGPNADNFTSEVSYSYTVNNGAATTVNLALGTDLDSGVAIVTNSYTRQLGSVRFTKAVEGRTYGDTFTFVATFVGALTQEQKTRIAGSVSIDAGGSIGPAPRWTGNQLTISGVVVTIADNRGSATITIGNVPKGVTVTVTESAAPNYTTSYAPGSLSGEAGAAENPTNLGTITNVRKSAIDLTIEKIIEGLSWNSAAFDDGILFTVTGPKGWGYANGVDSTDDFIAGVTGVVGTTHTDFTVLLTRDMLGQGDKSNWAILTLEDVPYGSYTITERTSTTEANSAYVDGFTLATYILISGDSAEGLDTDASTSPNNGSPLQQDTTVTFRNVYTQRTGGFVFIKLFDDYTFRPGDSFTFQLTFTLNGQPYSMRSHPGLPDLSNYDLTWIADNVIQFTVAPTAGEAFPTFRFTGLPMGLVCEAEEFETIPADYYNYSSTPFVVDDEGVLEFRLTNTRRYTGELTVTKTVDGAPDDGEDFTFYLIVGNAAWTGPYTVGDGPSTPIGANGSFTLKAGQTATFTGLPLGVNYWVQETAATHYTTTAKLNGTPYNMVSNTVNGTIDAEEAVEFINTRGVGSLEITKTTTSSVAEVAENHAFLFKLERQSLLNSNNWTQIGENISVTSGTPATINNLPHGIYRLIELDSGVDYDEDSTFIWKVNGDNEFVVNPNLGGMLISDTITVDGEKTVAVNNVFARKTNSLTVTKTVESDAPTEFTAQDGDELEFNFKLMKVVSGGEDEPVYIEGQTTADGTFTLIPGTPKVFENLDYGATYYVDEVSPPSVPNFTDPEVTTKVNNEVGDRVTLTVATPNQAIAVNNHYTRQTGSLKVEKALAGDIETIITPFTFTLSKQVIVGGVATYVAPETFTLTADGRPRTFTLPTGTYKITEKITEGAAAIGGHAHEVSFSGDGTDDPDDPASRLVTIVRDEGVEITCTNNYQELFGDLTITKALGDTLSETIVREIGIAQYDFTITGVVAGWGTEFDELTPVADGKNLTYNFTLTADDATGLVLTGIPIGSYTITEVSGPGMGDDPRFEASVDIKGATTVNDYTATVEVEDNRSVDAKSVTFTNTFERKLANLTIEKWIKNTSKDSGVILSRDMTFTFDIVDAEGNPFRERSFQVPVNMPMLDGRGAVIENVVPGTYYIKETTTAQDLAIPMYSYDSHSFTGATEVTAFPEGHPLYGEKDWYKIEVTGEIGTPKDISVVCTNLYEKDGAELRVKKTVAGFTQAEQEFTFRLAIGDGHTQDAREIEYFVIDAEGKLVENHELGQPTGPKQHFAKVTSEPNTYQFTLKVGEIAVFRQMDPAKTHTVTEVDIDDDFTLGKIEVQSFAVGPDDKTLDWTEEDLAAKLTPVDATVVLPKASAMMGQKVETTEVTYPGLHFTFTNTRTNNGALTIYKAFEGQIDDPAEAFTVHVKFFETLTGKPVQVDASKFAGLTINGEAAAPENFSGNTLVVTITKDARAAITRIPSGVRYEVEEILHSAFVYEPSYAGKTGTFGTGEGENEHTCTITNKRVTNGSVVITKIVIAPDETDAKHDTPFNVVVTFKNGSDWDETLLRLGGLFTVSVGGTILKATVTPIGDVVEVAFEIQRGEENQVTIANIPVGCTYVIDETGPGEYEPFVTNCDGKVNPFIKALGKLDVSVDTPFLYNLNIPSDMLMITKAAVIAIEDSVRFDEAYAFELRLTQPGEGSIFEQNEIFKLGDEVANILAGLEDEQQAYESNAERAEDADSEVPEDIEEALASYHRHHAALEKAQQDHDDEYERIENEISPTDEPCLTCLTEGIISGGQCLAAGCNSGRIEIDHEEDGCTGFVTCLTCRGSGLGDLIETPCDTCGEVEDTTGCGDAHNGSADYGVCDACGGLSDPCAVTHTKDCEACVDGVVSDETDCPNCEDGYYQDDSAKKAAQATADAELKAVQDEKQPLIKGIEEAYDGFKDVYLPLLAKIARFEVIQDKLDVEGIIVDFNPDGTINSEGAPTPRLPYELNIAAQAAKYKGDDKIDGEALTPVKDSESGEVLYYTFTLKEKERLVITGLPEGTGYEVKELAPADRDAQGEGVDHDKSTVLCSKHGDDCGCNDASMLSRGDVPLTAEKKGTAIFFTNAFETPTGSITVVKKWDLGQYGEIPADALANGLQVRIRSNKGYDAVVTLLENNRWTGSVSGLPLNAEYVIDEINLPVRFTVAYSNGTGENPIVLTYGNPDGNATITNTYSYTPPVVPDDPEPYEPINPPTPYVPNDPVPTDPAPSDPVPADPVVPDPDPDEELGVDNPLGTIDPDEELGLDDPLGGLPQTGVFGPHWWSFLMPVLPILAVMAGIIKSFRHKEEDEQD